LDARGDSETDGQIFEVLTIADLGLRGTDVLVIDAANHCVRVPTPASGR